MRKVILNIGLNNNPLKAGEIVTKVRENIVLHQSIINIDVRESFWLNDVKKKLVNVPEDTLILEFKSPYKLSTLIDKIERLASVLNQQCIAAKIDGNGLLVYRIDYKEERQIFDKDLFLTL